METNVRNEHEENERESTMKIILDVNLWELNLEKTFMFLLVSIKNLIT